jgi:hypothetical protein
MRCRRQTTWTRAAAALGGLGFFCAGCGAPTKSAGDVAHLFEGDGATLQAKVDQLCTTLRSRTTAPTLQNLAVDPGSCGSAGVMALDFKKIDKFAFQGVDEAGTGNGKLIHVAARSQVWLNKSLLGFATAVSGALKKKNGEAGVGPIEMPDSSGGKLGGLATTQLTQLVKPTFDLETLKFTTKINLKLSGIVTADHDLDIDGQLLDGAFAVTVKTTADREKTRSILKNFNALILIVPHAGDVYLDLFVDLNAYDFGIESVFREQLKAALGSGLKGAIDSVMQL